MQEFTLFKILSCWLASISKAKVMGVSLKIHGREVGGLHHRIIALTRTSSDNFKLQCWVTKMRQTKDKFQYGLDNPILDSGEDFMKQKFANYIMTRSPRNVILILWIKSKNDIVTPIVIQNYIDLFYVSVNYNSSKKIMQ